MPFINEIGTESGNRKYRRVFRRRVTLCSRLAGDRWPRAFALREMWFESKVAHSFPFFLLGRRDSPKGGERTTTKSKALLQVKRFVALFRVPGHRAERKWRRASGESSHPINR